MSDYGNGLTPILARTQKLGRGVNIGSTLDAPREGQWSRALCIEDFYIIAEAGFDHVRIPVRWSAHADDRKPYTIDSTFAARVAWAVDSALAAGLRAVINVHHYEAMNSEPDLHIERLHAIWGQISELFRDYPESLYFELFNEPHGRLDAENNNRLIASTLGIIRAIHDERAIIVGSCDNCAIQTLSMLELPETDRNLIASFHYYEPLDFTHQGAAWVHRGNLSGIDWPGSSGSLQNLAADFEQAAAWAKKFERPLYLGEFGTYETVAIDARVRWTSAVAERAAINGIPYAYWDFQHDFGLFDPVERKWRQELVEAVLAQSSNLK